MRVTIVSRVFTPEPTAASFALRTLAERLRDRGHEVTVVTSEPPKGTQISDPESIRVRRARVLRDRDGYVRGYLQYLSFDVPLAFRLLFARRSDVLFVEPPPTTGAVVRVIGWLRRESYVYDAADIWSDAARNLRGARAAVRILTWIERFALRGARAIVTISDGVARRLLELNVSVPTSVTGFGADTSAFRFESSSEIGEPFFVYPGSYSAWHGAEIFVDAFARLALDLPTYRLIFIGNGTEQHRLRERANRLGIGERVEFLPPVPASELNRILSRATAALASLRPGAGYDYAFATKTYSALAAGCPVVFTGPGPTGPFLDAANSELRAGSVSSFDTGAVAAAMQSYTDHPVSEAERRALSAWVSRKHSLTSVADRICAVLEKVANQQ